jgi:2-methylcitrate dehydratase PrpD
MNDGSQLISPPTIARGNPENPLSDAEVKEKFFDLALSIKTQDECDQIFDVVMNLGSNTSARALTDLL